MARKFLTAIDLGQNEIQNVVAQNLASAPSSPVKGQFYMNSADNTFYWWDGTTWQPAKGGLTQTQGDARYVLKAGDAMSGDLTTHRITGPAADNFFLNAVTGQSLRLMIGDNTKLYVGESGINANVPITLPADPVNYNEAATKQYVDNLTAGLSWKEAVRAASTANGTLATAYANGQVIDGVTLATGNRILIKNQTTGAENGIYVVTAGAPTRATDADAVGDLEQATVFIADGTTLADTAWTCTTNGAITPGTTATAWAQFAGTGGSVPPARTINTLFPLSGGGALTADLTLAMAGSTTAQVGATRYATTAEATAAALTNCAVTPAGLADRVLTSRTITTTAPLTGGGDLSANRTLDISTFTATVKGAVPPPTTATGKFLKDDGTWATVLAKYTQATVGGATSQVITHNLNSQFVNVSVFRTAAPYDNVECDIERTTVNTITLRFNVAPATNEYSVVVVG